MADECYICLEPYTNKRNPKIVCQHCPANACKQCLQQFLLLTYEDPHCGLCKRGWNSDFMGASFPISFRNGLLRAHRRKVLCEREKSLLPALQIYAEARRTMERLNKDKMEIYAKLSCEVSAGTTIGSQYRNLKNKQFVLDYNIRKQKKEIIRLKAITDSVEQITVPTLLLNARNSRNAFREQEKEILKELEIIQPQYLELKEANEKITAELKAVMNMYYDKAAPTERREFIMRCPADECRGFLSTAYKCGTCEAWTCKECHVSVGKDKDAQHTCDPDMVLSAKAIKEETRPCPKCGTRIFKTDGCFARDTPILLWDGTTKLSQDIRIGDTLIGDDGRPRTVEQLCSGHDEMYRVDQRDGMSYVVNSRHKLVLKFSGHKMIYW